MSPKGMDVIVRSLETSFKEKRNTGIRGAMAAYAEDAPERD